MNHLRHQKYKSNKQLNNKRVLKVQNSALELENDFKSIIISMNDMDKFEKKNYQKIEHLQIIFGTIGMIA